MKINLASTIFFSTEHAILELSDQVTSELDQGLSQLLIFYRIYQIYRRPLIHLTIKFFSQNYNTMEKTLHLID